MSSRQRYLRPLALFILMTFLSLSLMGRLDNRLNIGGFDSDFDFPLPINTNRDTKPDPDVMVSGGAAMNQESLPEEEQPSFDESQPETADAAVNQGTQGPMEKSEEPVPAVTKVESDCIPQAGKPSPEAEREKAPVLVHTVCSGETLWDIAKSYGITIDSILSSNDIPNSNKIQVGQRLQILTVQGVLHQVSPGESVWEIAQRYGVPLSEITSVNSIADANTIQPGAKLVIPGATRLQVKDALVVSGQLQRAFDWPAKARISSPFGLRWGRMHNGLDIAVVTGTPVKAAADGKVIYSGTNGDYGIMVAIDHGNGVETRYAHHSRNVARVGQTVKRGDIIAYSGNTGNSTGPHLHFEIRYNGTPVDPQLYLKN